MIDFGIGIATGLVISAMQPQHYLWLFPASYGAVLLLAGAVEPLTFISFLTVLMVSMVSLGIMRIFKPRILCG